MLSSVDFNNGIFRVDVKNNQQILEIVSSLAKKLSSVDGKNAILSIYGKYAIFSRW